jgi:hypothetical protein
VLDCFSPASAARRCPTACRLEFVADALEIALVQGAGSWVRPPLRRGFAVRLARVNLGGLNRASRRESAFRSPARNLLAQREERALFDPQTIYQTAVGHANVVVGDWLIDWHVGNQDTTFGKAHR